MSISQTIRAAITTRASGSISGFPAVAQRAYEAVEFKPTIGTPWARIVISPASILPFDVKAAQRMHEGLAIITIFQPAGLGTAAAETSGDATRDAFPPGMRLYRGSERVQIVSSERRQAVIEPDWISVPIEIRWKCFTTSA